MSPDSDKYFGSVLQQNLAIKILLKMRIRQRNGDANGVRMWPRQLHQTMNTKRRSTTTRARRTTMTTSSHSGANNMMVAMAAAA